MTPEQLTATVIDVLNTAAIADPEAIQALIENRVPCNQELIDHPYVTVSPGFGTPGRGLLGVLGIVNGILNAANAAPIAACWEDPVGDSPGRFSGFRVWEQKPAGSPAAASPDQRPGISK